MSRFLREVFITLLIAVVLFLGIHYSIQNPEVIGPSMQPDLHTGERVLVNKLAYRFGGTPHRGDVIVLVPPENMSSMDFIKRVIGLPGERVEIRDGKVYIHEADNITVIPLDEPYVTNVADKDYMSAPIPAGHYFVMGDNRTNSTDSRAGDWTVPLKDIVGKAWLITWPFSDFGAAPNYALPQG